MDANLSEFCKRHSIQIVDTLKRCIRYRPINHFFTNPDDLDCAHYTKQYETEIMYTVHIPYSELTKIQEFEDRVFNNMKQEGHYRMFNTMMEQKERESALRKQYPAVQLAYEQYSLMLNLCKDN